MTNITESEVVPVEKLSDEDKRLLELNEANRRIARAEMAAATARSESIETQYKYLVLQLFVKYNLTSEDSINEAGVIIRGGAKSQ
jgi:hypothetical protein